KFRRVHKRAPQAIDGELLEELASEMAVYHDLFESRHRALRECLAALGKRERDLVSVAYSVNVTKKDASRLLGMSQNGLYKALARIRQRLHKCILHRLIVEGQA